MRKNNRKRNQLSCVRIWKSIYKLRPSGTAVLNELGVMKKKKKKRETTLEKVHSIDKKTGPGTGVLSAR